MAPRKPATCLLGPSPGAAASIGPRTSEAPLATCPHRLLLFHRRSTHIADRIPDTSPLSPPSGPPSNRVPRSTVPPSVPGLSPLGGLFPTVCAKPFHPLRHHSRRSATHRLQILRIWASQHLPRTSLFRKTTTCIAPRNTTLVQSDQVHIDVP